MRGWSLGRVWIWIAVGGLLALLGACADAAGEADDQGGGEGLVEALLGDGASPGEVVEPEAEPDAEVLEQAEGLDAVEPFDLSTPEAFEELVSEEASAELLEEIAPEVEIEPEIEPEIDLPPPLVEVPRASLADGFHVPLVLPEEGAPFSLIMASDPQLWWNFIDGSAADVYSDAEIEAQNELHISAMNALIAGEQLPAEAPPPLAVVMNGDLTEYGRWKQWDAYYRLYEGVEAPIFDGLGNHDYENNNEVVASGCGMDVAEWQLWRDACEAGSSQSLWGSSACEVKESITELWTWCARDTMRRMRHWLSTHAEALHSWDEGSAAYSFEIGRFHFIQLHNGFDYEVPETTICGSLAWLKADLKDAFLRGRWIVLLMHRPISYALREHLQGYEYNIVGVFYGHHHGYAGHTDDFRVGEVDIPEFYCGSVQWNLFSFASFAEDHLRVTAIDSNTGAPLHYDTAAAYDNLNGATVWAPYTYVFPVHGCPGGQIPTGPEGACEVPAVVEEPSQPVSLCY